MEKKVALSYRAKRHGRPVHLAMVNRGEAVMRGLVPQSGVLQSINRQPHFLVYITDAQQRSLERGRGGPGLATRFRAGGRRVLAYATPFDAVMKRLSMSSKPSKPIDVKVIGQVHPPTAGVRSVTIEEQTTRSQMYNFVSHLNDLYEAADKKSPKYKKRLVVYSEMHTSTILPGGKAVKPRETMKLREPEGLVAYLKNPAKRAMLLNYAMKGQGPPTRPDNIYAILDPADNNFFSLTALLSKYGSEDTLEAVAPKLGFGDEQLLVRPLLSPEIQARVERSIRGQAHTLEALTGAPAEYQLSHLGIDLYDPVERKLKDGAIALVNSLRKGYAPVGLSKAEPLSPEEEKQLMEVLRESSVHGAREWGTLANVLANHKKGDMAVLTLGASHNMSNERFLQYFKGLLDVRHDPNAHALVDQLLGSLSEAPLSTKMRNSAVRVRDSVSRLGQTAGMLLSAEAERDAEDKRQGAARDAHRAARRV
jgi:hypothetical protein